jgi:hypothetical protein
VKSVFVISGFTSSVGAAHSCTKCGQPTHNIAVILFDQSCETHGHGDRFSG